METVESIRTVRWVVGALALLQDHVVNGDISFNPWTTDALKRHLCGHINTGTVCVCARVVLVVYKLAR